MELTIENIIKIIIGLVVVAIIAYAIYYFFTNYVLDTFKNFGTNTTAKLFIGLL